MKERKTKVSIQGYEGCFHQIAAHEYFGDNVEILPCATFREVTAAVEKGTVNAGVMAIENSIAGSIMPNYRLLQNSSLTISGEINLPIRQNLMVQPGVKLEEITEIESHPMAILQCLDFIEGMNRKIKIVESEDTALSARRVAEGSSRTTAAIAGDLAAKLFGLDIVAPNINTVKNNYTRFLILEKSDKVIPPANADKASLYFKVSHEHGALLTGLQSFSKKNINMTKLQSYPIPEDPFRYLFHVDVTFRSLEDFREAVEELRRHSEDFCICGVYRSAKL